MRRFLRAGVTAGRWWFGVSWLALGVGGLIAGPIMLSRGDYGGVYMLVGSPLVAVAGWAIHPWGLQRGRARRLQEPVCR